MAKGDIDKSDANGSRKNEKQSKENKEKDSKKSSTANGQANSSQSRAPSTVTRPEPASTGIDSQALKELTKSVRLKRSEIKDIKKSQEEKEKEPVHGQNEGHYFYPPNAYMHDYWNAEPFYPGAEEYQESADDCAFSFDSPDVAEAAGNAAEAAGNAGSNVNKQNDKPDDDMISLSSENSEKELDPVVEKFDAYLAEFITPDEKTSAAVYPSLAKGVNKMFDEGMGFETFRKKSADIPRPENCTALYNSVNVDGHVNKLLKHQTKKFDDRLKVVSTAITKAGQCFTRVIDSIQREFVDAKKSDSELSKAANDITATGMTGVAMLGHGFHNLCLRRRELQKPDVAWKYNNLFDADVKHNDYLYGGNENVERLVKDVNSSNRLRPMVSSGRGGPKTRAGGYYHSGPYYARGRGRARPSPYPLPYPQYSNRGGYAYPQPSMFLRGRGQGQARGRAMASKGSASHTKGEVSLKKINSHAQAKFIAGRLKQFLPQWEKITTDPEVLQTVQGCTIEFVNNTIPSQQGNVCESHFSREKSIVISTEIEKLLEKQVLEKVESEDGEFISPIFLRPKKNGSYRMILNLKEFNQNVEYHHFKMETFEKALTMISQGNFLASMDIKDAYYCVPIHTDDRKYLRFLWEGQLLQLTCVPNGLSCGPRKYTKMMKPVYAFLRSQGHTISGYIDDTLIVADSEAELQQSIKESLHTFETLGFIINHEKSMLSPHTRLTYLGYVINTNTMMVTLPQDKIDTVVHQIEALLQKRKVTVRNVAKIIGSLVACFPAAQYGPLHYRKLEREKIATLKVNRGNYDGFMTITREMEEELCWWKDNISTQYRCIIRPNPNLIVTTDASLEGWGSVCDNERTGGRWNEEE